MTKNACKFDMRRYATPKGEEDRRTLSEYGYRVLTDVETLDCIKVLESITARGSKVEKLPVVFAEGNIELRYYKKGAKSTGKKEGNSIFMYDKKNGVALPILLMGEGEAKLFPSIAEVEKEMVKDG